MYLRAILENKFVRLEYSTNTERGEIFCAQGIMCVLYLGYNTRMQDARASEKIGWWNGV